MTRVVDFESAYIHYEATKRNPTDAPSECFSLQTGLFEKIKKQTESPDWIPFINTFAVCKQIIAKYLDQPGMEEHKMRFLQLSKGAKNAIVAFLWYWEPIDGCYPFEQFERRELTKIIRKWCKSNQLDLALPNDGT